MDDEAFELYNTFSSKRLDEANKIGKINLAAIGKDLMEDEKQGDVAIYLFPAIDLESEAVTERASELEYNQTLCLLTGFLSVNDWYHARILFDRLSPLNPFVTNYSGSLKSLSPQHMNLSGKLIFRTWCCLQQLLVIQWKQIHLYIDFSLTFRKSFLRCFHVLDLIVTVIHCCCRRCSDGSSDPESGSRVNETPRLHLKEAKFRIEEALGTCLLPSLQLIPANPVVGQEIWEVMNLLPYEARYRLYGEWEKDESVFQWFWLQGKLQSSFNS